MTHELKLLFCENCGHDEFIEIALTESRVVGKFALTKANILLIERDDPPEYRERSHTVRCLRCRKPAYEWLSPIGDDAPGYKRRGQERERPLRERLKESAMILARRTPEQKKRSEDHARRIREEMQEKRGK